MTGLDLAMEVETPKARNFVRLPTGILNRRFPREEVEEEEGLPLPSAATVGCFLSVKKNRIDVDVGIRRPWRHHRETIEAPNMSSITKMLPKMLVDRAFSANNEYAWSRPDALKVISLLSGAEVRILGVDVWVPSPGGPIIPAPFIYDWSERDAADRKTPFASASEFVEGFEWDAADVGFRDREPYFNFTLE